MSTLPTYSIFPNGTAFMCWYDRNCDRCKKGPTPEHIGQNPLCDIEDTIALASCLDGKLTLDGTKTAEEAAALAARLKWDGQSYLETDCPEFEPRTCLSALDHRASPKVIKPKNTSNIMDPKAPKLIKRKPISLAPIERPLVDALQTYGSGLPQEEEPLIKASAAWREIVQAVRDRGGKGELTIKLCCTGDAGKQVTVDCDVKTKMPARKPQKRLLFADDNGDVVTMDPDQMQFEPILDQAAEVSAK